MPACGFVTERSSAALKRAASKFGLALYVYQKERGSLNNTGGPIDSRFQAA
jgi:hypothetical protein